MWFAGCGGSGEGGGSAAFSFAAFRLRRHVGKDEKMNKRKPVDYTAMYTALDTLLQTDLPEAELYFEIGRAVCARPEKGAAVMAAEYFQANYPECKGFSPRNLRRMREFYRSYADNSELRAMALKLGWTQNAVILEECEDSRELAWYLRSALEHHWTKAELLGQIQAGAWLREGLDEPDNTCYTENNTVSAGCLEHEEDPFGEANTITLTIMITNMSDKTFSGLDLALVNDYNAIFRPSIFGDTKLMFKQIKPGDKVVGHISFAVDNINRKFWLTFYDRRTRKPLSKISIDNAYRKVSAKTKKKNDKVRTKRSSFKKVPDILDAEL